MKTKSKVEAPAPLGAAPFNGQALRKRLTEMAKRMEKDPKKRKAFIAQGMVAIEQVESKKKLRERFNLLVDDLKPLLEKHGVTCFHLVTKQKVDPKAAKLGNTGWMASSRIDDAETALTLVGMLTTGINELSGRRLGTSRF